MGNDQTRNHQHDQGHGQEHDHTEHHRMMIRDFRLRFFITVVLTLPVLALATVIFFYGGRPFLSGLVSELK